MNLTREDILKLEGKALDAAIAEFVMGDTPVMRCYDFAVCHNANLTPGACKTCKHYQLVPPELYSTDWNVMREVIEHIREEVKASKPPATQEFLIEITSEECYRGVEWSLEMSGGGCHAEATAPTLPVAVGRVALLRELNKENDR